MEGPLPLQFWIALFTGMVAATFVPPIRKSIPRFVEVSLWIALFTACVLGVLSVADPNAHDLAASIIWAIDEVINMIAGLVFSSVAAWISDNRFTVATWLVILAGVDVFVLMALMSIRSAAPWQPRVRLREWMELPVPAPVAARRAVAADPFVGANRRLAGASALAAAAMLAWSLDVSIRARDAVRSRRLHHAARAGADGSRAGLESLRSAVAHLQFAAHSWYTAAGQPAMERVAEHATDAMRSAKAARRRLRMRASRPNQVIDIRTLVDATSIGWYGPLGAAHADSTTGDDDATDAQRPDTLAS